MRVRVRKAMPGEGESLTGLCIRSKAHWGYDGSFMKMSAASLTVSEEDIALGRVLVAVDANGRLLGMAAVLPEGGTADLDALFVDPPAIGRGAGRLLLEAASELGRALGAKRLTILPDPNATSFYERMGARYLRHAPSDAIPGRMLPFNELDLTPRTVS